VLVILSRTSIERISLQLACLQSGLIFCSCDPKELAVVGISERIQKLAVDCVITDGANLESVKAYTHNPLRPLKKGLTAYSVDSKPLPVGWIDLARSANDAEVEYKGIDHFQPNAPAMRLLTKKNQVIECSRQSFHDRLMSTA
jgi:acyl-coenzyme A synthetase/AMP-(fatty) acid ligase